MKTILKAATVFWLLLVGNASGMAEETKGDVTRLQGKWTSRAGSSGELLVTLEFEGSGVEVLVQTPQGLTIRARGEVKLDETTSPRSVDWDGFKAGEFQTIPEIQGVYRWDGDSFVLCNGGFNGARPDGFTAGDGPLAEVMTFTRVEAPAVADARPSP